jgi:hypothetical protein
MDMLISSLFQFMIRNSGMYLHDEPQGVAEAATTQEECPGDHAIVAVTTTARRRRAAAVGGSRQLECSRPQVQKPPSEQAHHHRPTHARQSAHDLHPASPFPQRHTLRSESMNQANINFIFTDEAIYATFCVPDHDGDDEGDNRDQVQEDNRVSRVSGLQPIVVQAHCQDDSATTRDADHLIAISIEQMVQDIRISHESYLDMSKHSQQNKVLIVSAHPNVAFKVIQPSTTKFSFFHIPLQ